MERLTEKYNDAEKGIVYDLAPHNFSDDLSTHNAQCEVAINRVIDKLGQLEDIEEELGIDLVTLFKVYINGFYIKGETEKQYIDFENPLNSIAFKNGEMFYGHRWSYQYVKLYDYGKTWALTKEELL